MDTSIRTLPDEAFSIIQKKLRNWMRVKGFVTWKQIQKACRDLLEVYPQDYILQYGNFPEYKLFMPLLRKGKCEIAQLEGKTVFVCFPKNEYLENPRAKKLQPISLSSQVAEIIKRNHDEWMLPAFNVN